MKKIRILAMIGLMTVLGGCGTVIAKESHTRPPELTVTSVLEEAGGITLNAGSYSWNYRISKEEESGGVADAPHPLAEEYPREILVLPVSSGGEEQYRISMEWIVRELEDESGEASVNWPDELVIDAYDESAVGTDLEVSPLESVTYSGEELEEEGFALPLKPGRVYELILTWDEDGYKKDGFHGTASYVFQTTVSAPEES